MLYRVRKYLRNRILKQKIRRVLRNKYFDPSQAILLFSDPRGGSTWLTEIIYSIEHTAVIWEPLHLGEDCYFRKLNFDWRQYIPKGEKWDAAKNAFDLLFRGRLLTPYSLHLSKVEDFHAADRIIVKFCRGNALLPWLVEQFQFHCNPIYLIRHPFAVVASQMEQGGWNERFEGYTIPQTPFNTLYLKHADFLTTLGSKEESLCATWCIANQIPLTDEYNNKKWITIQYEKLVLNPEAELSRIFERWNMDMPVTLLERVRQPSVTTVNPGALKDGLAQLGKWNMRFSPETLKKMTRVLEYFEVQDYSSEVLPLKLYR